MRTAFCNLERARCGALLLLLLAGCKQDEVPHLLAGLCTSLAGSGSQLTSHTDSCEADVWASSSSLDNLGQALDGLYESYALLHGPTDNCGFVATRTTVLATAPAGIVRQAGTTAGALIREPYGDPSGASSFQMRVTTYRGGVLQDSGVAVAGYGTDAEDYYGVATTREYDAIELEFEVSGVWGPGDGDGPAHGDTRIYEICTR